MTLRLFFNELSLTPDSLTRASAISFLKELVATTRAAKRLDEGLIFYCETPVHSLPLGADHTIASIRNSNECLEESLFLKALQNRAPLSLALVDVKESQPETEYHLSDAAPIHASRLAYGLGLSHLLTGLGISLRTHEYWAGTYIDLHKLQLDESGGLSSSLVKASNVATPSGVDHHADAFPSSTGLPFKNGKQLWNAREEVLPNLAFIPRTEGQICGILDGDPTLSSIWNKLLGIDQAIAVWREAGATVPSFGFNVRPESRSRLSLVDFADNDGVTQSFSLHTDFAPGEGRIHFIVESTPSRRALIGHVGRKLGIG